MNFPFKSVFSIFIIAALVGGGVQAPVVQVPAMRIRRQQMQQQIQVILKQMQQQIQVILKQMHQQIQVILKDRMNKPYPLNRLQLPNKPYSTQQSRFQQTTVIPAPHCKTVLSGAGGGTTGANSAMMRKAQQPIAQSRFRYRH